ncbi:twin-arginine translocase TatA/TatE family subunit [Candidatus Poriferisodalis sp.]|uniref:twin-arginine translocase TatA/TatE family subunit n=1 Tax=Candidatus Poriferisodalis sp. TaxID=3101277 RepID=UPI003B5CA713
MSLQPNEVLIIAFVALIVLGPTRLPGAIRSIGRFFRQVRDFSTTVRQEMDATLSPPNVEPASSPNPPTPADPAEAPGAQGEGESSQSDAADPAADRSTSDGPA